jgi:hypothetical protein
VACDHYHRYAEDVEWMSRLGVNAYRMGIEWSRLQAAPFAPLNRPELERYVHLLDRLKAANITPMVVLHHFSNPPWITFGGRLAESGGGSGVRGLCDEAGVGLEGTGLFVEHVQRAGHLRVADVSARRISAVPQMAAGVLPENHQAHGGGARAGGPRHPARRGNFGGKTPEVGIAKNWTFFGAFQARGVGPSARGNFPSRLQSFCAGRISGRSAAGGVHVSGRQLLWPRAVEPF